MSFHCARAHRHLRSFPTRRSSDLGEGLRLVRQRVALLQPDARHHRGADERQVKTVPSPASRGFLIRKDSLAMSVIKMSDLDLSGKRVLIREDLNVPVKDGQVTDDTRIRASLATIELALDAGARVMVMSHLGRPNEGEFSPEN